MNGPFCAPLISYMNRRRFIRNSSVVSISAASLSVAACTTDKQTPAETDSATFADDFELNGVTVSDLQNKITSGQYTSERITKLHLDRIKAIDKNGAHLNAVAEVNPDALAMDQERKTGKVRGPLHGIPILIKDNIDTADQMMTTESSSAPVPYWWASPFVSGWPVLELPGSRMYWTF